MFIILDYKSIEQNIGKLDFDFPISFIVTSLTDSLIESSLLEREAYASAKYAGKIKIFSRQKFVSQNEYFEELNSEYKEILYLACEIHESFPTSDIRITLENVKISELPDRVDSFRINELFDKKTISPSRFYYQEQSKIKQENLDPNSLINIKIKKRRKRILLFQILTQVIYFIIVIGEKYSREIFANIHFGVIIFLTFLFGFLLFLFRENYRLGYGIVELMVGATTILSVFFTTKFEYTKVISSLELNVKIGGGLYIMVRGFDNITKAVEKTKTGNWLKKYLGVGK